MGKYAALICALYYIAALLLSSCFFRILSKGMKNYCLVNASYHCLYIGYKQSLGQGKGAAKSDIQSRRGHGTYRDRALPK